MCLVTNYGTRGYELDVRCVVKVTLLQRLRHDYSQPDYNV